MPKIIDTTKSPFVPDGLTVQEHRTNGPLVWDPVKVELFKGDYRVAIPEDKKDDDDFRTALSVIMSEGATGFDIMKGIKEKGSISLNSNVLDFLINNQELIPEDWKTCDEGLVPFIYFLGTIYNKQDENGKDNLCACYLYWNKTHWDWDYKMLYYVWDVGEFAAINA